MNEQFRLSDLQTKDVVNVRDGKNFGRICDMEMDAQTGNILRLVLPGRPRFFGLFGRDEDRDILWDQIKLIGIDAVSYTHLDVYKRQACLRARADAGVAAVRRLFSGLGDVFQGSRRSAPVSYTHLLDLALAPPAVVVDAPGQIGTDVLPLALHVVEDRIDLFIGQRVDAPEPVSYTHLDVYKRQTPEDAPQRYEPTEIYVPNTEETRFDILTKYAEYDRSREYGSSVDFILGGETPAILEKYGYSKYIEGLDSSSDELAFKLLDFVCDHFGHNGTNGMGGGTTIPELIGFCERNGGKSNCRGLAILLAALLRLNGIKAQHITCMPYEEPFDDCHVVVDCLLPSGKRIMLDPTWRLYLKDKDDEYVSLPHLRELLLAGEPIWENPTADYNGQGFTKEYHRNYMTKNLSLIHISLTAAMSRYSGTGVTSRPSASGDLAKQLK